MNTNAYFMQVIDKDNKFINVDFQTNNIKVIEVEGAYRATVFNKSHGEKIISELKRSDLKLVPMSEVKAFNPKLENPKKEESKKEIVPEKTEKEKPLFNKEENDSTNEKQVESEDKDDLPF